MNVLLCNRFKPPQHPSRLGANRESRCYDESIHDAALKMSGFAPHLFCLQNIGDLTYKPVDAGRLGHVLQLLRFMINAYPERAI